MNNNKKINYYNTPNERRRSGNLYVDFMTNILGLKKIFKHIKNIESNYKYEERDKYQNVSPADDIFNQEGEI